MKKTTRSLLLRLVTLIAWIGNVAFNYGVARVDAAHGVARVSERHASPFTPADYAFSIWGPIYASMLVLALVALWPKNWRDRTYDRLAGPLLAFQAFSALWLVTFTRVSVPLSVAVIFCVLGAAWLLFERSHEAAQSGYSLWITVPGSLGCGWLVVATVANFSSALVTLDPGVRSTSAWVVFFVAATALASVSLALRRRDFLVPLVASWALVAIWFARRNQDETVAFVALASAIGTGLLALVVLGSRLLHSSRAAHAL